MIKMRRKDLEIKNIDTIKSLLNKCQVLHLAINDEKSPYIIPLSYGFSIDKTDISIFIHSGQIGKKYELLKKDKNVSVELEIFEDFKVSEDGKNINACNIGCYYQSLIGKGTANELNDFNEKSKALDLIVKHCGFNNYTMKEEQINKTAVFEIKINQYSVKGNI